MGGCIKWWLQTYVSSLTPSFLDFVTIPTVISVGDYDG